MDIKKISFIGVILISLGGLLVSPFCPQAQTAGYQLEVDYPTIQGTSPGNNLADYIHYIYLFGLSLIGIAALGALVFGGFQYMLSGTVTAKDEAKKWIQGALSGLALGFAAYLILNIINPDLVSLKTPEIITLELSCNDNSDCGDCQECLDKICQDKCGLCEKCEGGSCVNMEDGKPCPGGVCQSGACTGGCCLWDLDGSEWEKCKDGVSERQCNSLTGSQWGGAGKHCHDQDILGTNYICQ